MKDIRKYTKCRPLKQFANEILNTSTLHARINESEDVNVKNLTLQYNAKDKTYLEVPENYTESDIQIYVDDAILSFMPGVDENASKFFGSNSSDIDDAYMEYDSLSEAMGSDQKADIEWDPRYEQKDNKDEKLHIICIDNLRFIVKFSKFVLTNVSKGDVKYELTKIANTASSNSTNKYPIEITFDTNNIDFDVE
jgi:hypothetical protein